jgi:hypothetical protein
MLFDPLGNFGVAAQRRELIVSALGEDKVLPIIDTLDNNTHHFAVAREFVHLQDPIFFLFAIQLDLDGV